MSPARPSSPSEDDAVLVCGLGALGTACARTLRDYGVAVRALDSGTPDRRDLADLPFVQGDCRDAETLRRAGLEDCRAVLLATNDARVNIEAAMAARRLKPSLRIVARAGGHSLSALLSAFLGDFVAYEPSELAAGVLALAALGSDVIGQFHVEGRLVSVLRSEVRPGNSWLGAAVKRIQGPETVLLDHDPRGENPDVPAHHVFHDFDPDQKVGAGDSVTLLAIEQGQRTERVPRALRRARPRHPRVSLREQWLALGRPVHVLLGALALIVLSLLLAVTLFPRGEPGLSRADALFTALVLMTGGTYADLFPAFHHLSDPLRLLTVLLSLIGTLTIGMAYAWFTDRLMSWRLRLVPRRPPPPREGHIVVVGMGQVGRHAAALLEELRRPVAAIALEMPPEGAAPGVPLVVGNATDGHALQGANVAGARGVLAATPDDWTNLEIALRARQLNPACAVVIRTRDVRFSEDVADLLPDVQVLCVPVIAARALAAAALGSRVLGLFRLRGRSIYVVEYRVRDGDGFDGRLLGEVAEGYDLVPVWHEPHQRRGRFCLPTEPALRLAPGDRLVVLAPSTSLRGIQRGQMAARRVRLVVAGSRPFSDPLTLASALVKHLGCSLEQAHALLARLPCELPEALYVHQAHRLRSALEVAGGIVELRLLRDGSAGPPDSRHVGA